MLTMRRYLVGYPSVRPGVLRGRYLLPAIGPSGDVPCRYARALGDTPAYLVCTGTVPPGAM